MVALRDARRKRLTAQVVLRRLSGTYEEYTTRM